MASVGAGVVGTGVLRITLGSDDPAVAALELIDDAIFVDDTATHATGTTKLMGVGAVAVPTDTSITANDIGMLAMSTDRRLHTDAQIVGQDADITIADGGNTITVDGTVTANLSATDNAVLDTIDAVLDLINAKLVTGTVIGDVNLGATDNAVLDSIVTNQSARSTGGCKMFTSVDLDQTEEDVTTGATTIYGIYAWNLTAAPLWLQLFNTNTVTVGTTAPTNNFMIPANADSDGSGVVIPIPDKGLAYSTALTVAITTASGTTNGAPGVGDAGIVVLFQD
ncbi:hypothetical protein LCGC14_1715890 [marine sediment metagenome]|uniref:Uncharacterized protein n=1 Tax=marine sediment metagenome TaxID=412755 RepID=A0A0F9HDK9_9ZZZZ